MKSSENANNQWRQKESESPLMLKDWRKWIEIEAEGKMNWLPDMDLNHDKQIQSLLCYRYTIGQAGTCKVEPPRPESRLTKSLNRSIVEPLNR